MEAEATAASMGGHGTPLLSHVCAARNPNRWAAKTSRCRQVPLRRTRSSSHSECHPHNPAKVRMCPGRCPTHRHSNKGQCSRPQRKCCAVGP
eukprot:673016-Prymnesium_polylepis.1